MGTERREGLTAEEDLKQTFFAFRAEKIPSDTRLERLVDLIKELIDDRAGEKACEEIGKHEDDYDHDLMYNT